MGAQLPPLDVEEFGQRLLAGGSRPLSAGQVASLHRHYLELCRWNPRVTLVGPVEADEVVERHYNESLAALPLLDDRPGVLVDLGSGAGFPGLVLAAACPQLRVTLIEARERKWSFLLSACRAAALSCKCLNARVATTPIEGLPPGIDWITARAVSFEDLGLAVLLPRLKPQGALLLWVGEKSPDLPDSLRVRRQVSLAGSKRRRILEIIRTEDGAQTP